MMRTANLKNVTRAMLDPGFELDADEAAAIVSAFDIARESGHPFEPFTVALLEVLRRQLLGDDVDLEETVDDGWETRPIREEAMSC